jgi:hypothetical protein
MAPINSADGQVPTVSSSTAAVGRLEGEIMKEEARVIGSGRWAKGIDGTERIDRETVRGCFHRTAGQKHSIGMRGR